MRPHSFAVFSGAALFLVSGLSGYTPEAAAASGAGLKELRLAVVTIEPRQRISQYLDMAEYIAGKLGPDVKSGVVVAKDLDQLTTLIREKKVEIYMESAYPTYVVNKRTGARILARRWKGQVPEYSTVLFTRRGSGITEPKDLLGKVIAFEDRGSTSGYLLPNAYLTRRGFKLVEKSSFTDTVSAQEIGYVFAHGSETNILNWVLLGKVTAGAFNDNAFAQIEEERRRELSIFAETVKVPRHLLSVRGDVDAGIVKRLQAILLTMHEDDAGRKALRKALKTSKFDLLPGGEEAVYKKIEELFGVLGKSTH